MYLHIPSQISQYIGHYKLTANRLNEAAGQTAKCRMIIEADEH